MRYEIVTCFACASPVSPAVLSRLERARWTARLALLQIRVIDDGCGYTPLMFASCDAAFERAYSGSLWGKFSAKAGAAQEAKRSLENSWIAQGLGGRAKTTDQTRQSISFSRPQLRRRFPVVKNSPFGVSVVRQWSAQTFRDFCTSSTISSLHLTHRSFL